MSEHDLRKCGNLDGDGCVVHFKGFREYWCNEADQDSLHEQPIGRNDERIPIQKNVTWVYCKKLKRNVVAGI